MNYQAYHLHTREMQELASKTYAAAREVADRGDFKQAAVHQAWAYVIAHMCQLRQGLFGEVVSVQHDELTISIRLNTTSDEAIARAEATAVEALPPFTPSRFPKWERPKEILLEIKYLRPGWREMEYNRVVYMWHVDAYQMYIRDLRDGLHAGHRRLTMAEAEAVPKIIMSLLTASEPNGRFFKVSELDLELTIGNTRGQGQRRPPVYEDAYGNERYVDGGYRVSGSDGKGR